MHAVVPLKAFSLAKTRLAAALEPNARHALAMATADHVAAACVAAGFDLAIVTSDAEVRSWALEMSAVVVDDPATGLDDACVAGVAAVGGAFAVVHGDLPLLDRRAMAGVGEILARDSSVIAPSRDGGTNILGSGQPIRFRYGPGSFHRHLGMLAGGTTVLVSAATAVELDTPADLEAASRLPEGAWLRGYLKS